MDYRIIVLLFIGVMVFSGALVAVAFTLPGNAALYATLAGIAGNFSGAFFMHIQHEAKNKKEPE
jgi:uncharacterized membrane protein YgdD (TMEM256/DUF423 family)